MNAVVWKKTNTVCFEENYPEPRCKKNWVIIKVMSAGICATDLALIDGSFNAGDPPLVLGHEIAGVVTEIGKEVVSVKAGERVVVETAVSCGHCSYCESGNKHLCPDCHEIGFPPYDGGYAQYVTVPENCIKKLPDEMSFDEGGILEACLCPFGILYRHGMRLGETVLIQGNGVAGLAFLQTARCFSAQKVIMAVRRDSAEEMARKFGADVVINTKRENLYDRVMAETDGRGASLSIDATGSPKAIEAAVKLTESGGRCILYGLPKENEEISFPVKEIILRQLTILGGTNNQMAWDPLMNLIASGKFNIKDMVTEVFSLREIEKALADTKNRPNGFIKAVVHPWEGKNEDHKD